MNTVTVDALPHCSECTAEERREPKDAEFRVLTPMKITVLLCNEHFMNYVESRLGSNTLTRLALVHNAAGVQSAGGPVKRRHAA